MKTNAVRNRTMDKKTNRKPVRYRMVRETTYYYPSQIERAETLCLQYGLINLSSCASRWKPIYGISGSAIRS